MKKVMVFLSLDGDQFTLLLFVFFCLFSIYSAKYSDNHFLYFNVTTKRSAHQLREQITMFRFLINIYPSKQPSLLTR
jgi:hypothetical protein